MQHLRAQWRAAASHYQPGDRVYGYGSVTNPDSFHAFRQYVTTPEDEIEVYGTLGPPLYRSGLEVGQHVFIDHPEIGQPVGGEVTGEVPQSGLVMVRMDGTDLVAPVPLDMIRVAARQGPIYRGYQVTLPPDLRETVERYSQPPMEEWERNQHFKIGPAIIEWLQRSHPGGAYSEGLGLGRHWTTNRRFAEIATTHGNIGGNWPILLTATYDPSEVDPNLTMTTPFWAKSEGEVTLMPGARVTITAVEFPGSYIQGWGNFLASPVEARV